jgi:hypothetical protein
MKKLLVLTLLVASGFASAETPRQLMDGYAAEAAKLQAGFKPQAARGGAFYAQRFAVSEKMPGCTACHTENPAQSGQHAVTHKDIKPLATSANAERFTDPAKVEKWFRRNCKEVVGRECSAGEKADFIAYLSEGR